VHLHHDWWYPQRDAMAKARKEGCDWTHVKSEREHFARWLKDEWHYVGVVVTLFDADDNELGQESCWGIDDEDYAVLEVGNDLARSLVHAHQDEVKEREYWAARDVETTYTKQRHPQNNAFYKRFLRYFLILLQ
jgi:hypothetical protein